MKTPRLLTLFLLFAAVFAGLSPGTTARAEASFSFFYDSLDPLGDWIQTDDYGYCWRPDGVDAEWAPYTDGYWTYTDAGWTWVSYEDWGSICYHYGRWVNLEEEGWCWVPDYQWGPAWVSWRNSEEHVGWAPLPPEAHFTEDVGISVWADTNYDIGPSHYNFCAVQDFGAPVLRQVIIPRVQNVTFIQNTVNITNISYNRSNRFVCNGGPQYSLIAARTVRPVPTLKLVQNTNINIVNNTTIINKNSRNQGRGGRGLQHAVQRGNTLEVFAPTIMAPTDRNLVKPARVKRVLASRGVNKGWGGVQDPVQRESIRQKFRQQTAGLTPQNAPAKAVPVAELKVVPVKADPNAPMPIRGRGGKRNQENTVATPTAPDAPDQTPGGKPVPGVAEQNPKGGKRGNRKEGAEVTEPVQGAAVADQPDGRKGREGAKTGTPARSERVASPVATAEGERILEQKTGKKRQNEAVAETNQPQAETAKEAARQRRAEQADTRQEAVAREKAERQEQREQQQKVAAERKLQQAEQPRRQGQGERMEELQQQREANQAARAAELRQLQQQRESQRQERAQPQQIERDAQRQVERAQIQEREQQRQIEAERNNARKQAERNNAQEQQQRQMQVERAQQQQQERAAQRQFQAERNNVQQQQRQIQAERAQQQQQERAQRQMQTERNNGQQQQQQQQQRQMERAQQMQQQQERAVQRQAQQNNAQQQQQRQMERAQQQQQQQQRAFQQQQPQQPQQQQRQAPQGQPHRGRQLTPEEVAAQQQNRR